MCPSRFGQAMEAHEAVRRMLEGSDEPLRPRLIGEVLGLDLGQVQAVLADLERAGVACGADGRWTLCAPAATR